jgi:hypothetical protein
MRDTIIHFTHQIIEAAKKRELKAPQFISPLHLASLLNVNIKEVDEIYKTEFVLKLRPRPTAHSHNTYEIL